MEELESKDLSVIFIHNDDHDYETEDSISLACLSYKIPYKKVGLSKAIKENKFNLNKSSFTPVTFIVKNNNVQSHLYGDYDVTFIENEILKHL